MNSNFLFKQMKQMVPYVLLAGTLVMGISSQSKLHSLESQVLQLQDQLSHRNFAQRDPYELLNHSHRRLASRNRVVLGTLKDRTEAYQAEPSASSEQGSFQVARADSAALQDAQPLSEKELDSLYAGAGIPGPGLSSAAASPVAPASGSGQAEQAVSHIMSRVEKGGVLLPKGKLQVEPSFSYTHFSNNRVNLSGFSLFDVIFVGEIESNEVDRDILTSSLDMRYGLGRNLQAEVSIPSQYQRQETLSGPVNERKQATSSDAGMNDISGGFSYQFMHEHGSWPNMIAQMKLKAPTGQDPKFGSGVWGLKGGLVMMKSSDPVVLFSSMAYSLNFPGQINGIDVNPGNSIELSAGLAYALNYNLAWNTSIEQVFVGESTSNNSRVAGSRLVIANLKTGLTYALTKQLSLDFSVGAGLTEDSPDLSVTVSLPYTF